MDDNWNSLLLHAWLAKTISWLSHSLALVQLGSLQHLSYLKAYKQKTLINSNNLGNNRNILKNCFLIDNVHFTVYCWVTECFVSSIQSLCVLSGHLHCRHSPVVCLYCSSWLLSESILVMALTFETLFYFVFSSECLLEWCTFCILRR